MKVKDLREIAKSQGLKGYSRLKKSDLISFIKNNENHSSDRATEQGRIQDFSYVSQKFFLHIQGGG